METAEFEYPLPEAAIAQTPAEPRHAARLLDTRDMTDHRFLDLPDVLREDDLVVVNDTRVRVARLRGRKTTGGAVEALLLEQVGGDHWKALLRPARRLRAGSLLEFDGLRALVTADPVEGLTTLQLVPPEGEDAEGAMARRGRVPLPPYIKTPLGDPERYQTIFAATLGSAAAPTAGLHFTPEVVAGLRDRGVGLATVSLDVGVDTFRRIATGHLEDHRMHSERYRVREATVAAVETARRRKGRIVATGTTVVRTLEAAAASGRLMPGEAMTDLFIVPGYPFRVVDALITNFHIPGSTLIVLVAAFFGSSWRRIYAHALARGYRFLSFGDAMFGERAR